MLTFSCDEQISGFSEIDIYLKSETSNWPKVLTDQTSAQVQFTVEEHSIQGTVEESSINFDVTQKRKDLFEINGGFNFITRSEALEQMLDQYQNQEVIVIGKLMTGFKKMYGSNLQPLILNYRVDEGNKPEDSGRTIVTIKGSTRKRPVYYTVVDSE